jgi:hypothetical protein
VSRNDPRGHEWRSTPRDSCQLARDGTCAPTGPMQCSAHADSKLLYSFRTALSRCEGRARKAAYGQHRTDGRKQQSGRGCQMTLLSATNAGNTGTNRPHQAEISTAGRYLSRGGSMPTVTNSRVGYQKGVSTGRSNQERPTSVKQRPVCALLILNGHPTHAKRDLTLDGKAD